MNAGIINVLLVDDSATDVMLTQEAFAQGRLPNVMHVVDDGEKAMEFLHQTGRYGAVPRPDLILLDLNMPRKNGQEVLAEIKADENLLTIPVIILTTSRADTDIRQAYRHHANCYITKPVDFGTFAEVVRSIEDFWFKVTTLPNS